MKNYSAIRNYLSLDENNHGFVLIDKPSGWTSHDVVQKMRGLTGVKKIGHAGTLDPLATGLLILLIGKRYTRQQSTYLKTEKEYMCTAQFGIITDTYDSDGEIQSETSWEKLQKLSQEQVQAALFQFTGEIDQTVPAFSAVKIQGEKLYEMARRGKAPKKALPSRTVTISRFHLDTFTKDTEKKIITGTFTIACSSGTYIRSLIHDLGQSLDCGATVTSLRRTKVAEFSVENAHTIPEILETAQSA